MAPPAVPTQIKLELVQRLLHAGVKNIEVGSFVRGDWVPQVSNQADSYA
jgi:hydroxymethylglutaryl-CoA lyase